MRAGALAAVLLLAGIAAAGAPTPVKYRDASAGLPMERPGSADDAGWTGVRFADVNGDGWPDLGAIGRKGNGTRVYLGQRDGSWLLSVQGIPPHFSGRSDLRFGDLDRDGRLDLVESGGDVFLGLGDGAWKPATDLPFAGEDVALGDVDNDGDLDAVLVGHLSGGVRAYRNDRGAWASISDGLPTANGGHKIDLADVDRDGCLDIVAAYWYDGGVWLGDCAGHWRDASEGLRGFQAWDVATGDVDGDGHLDVVFSVFASSADEGLRVFRGDGRGGWSAPQTYLADESWGGMALEDAEGDGDLDIVAGRTCFGSCTARVALLLNDGAGQFAEVVAGLPQAVDELEGLAALDVDHNGKPDVGLAHYGDEGVHVWREVTFASVLGDARLLEPLGRERWVPGGVREVRWTAAVPPHLQPGSVNLAYSVTGPAGPWFLIASGLPNSGSFLWELPAVVTDDAYVRVRVIAGEGSVDATNPRPFSIGPAT